MDDDSRSNSSWHCGTIHHRMTKASKDAQCETLKIPLGAKVTNDTSGRVSEASCLSRDTPRTLTDAFSNRAPECPIHGQVNGTREQVCTHPRTTRTMEQVSGYLSRLILVSRVSPDPERGPRQTESNAQSSFGTYRSARVESHWKPHITAILTQLGVQCHRPCSKIPPGASGTAISFQPAQSGQFRPKIYMCSPPETTAGVIPSPLGIQRNQPRTKSPPRSTGTAPTSLTASRVCQSTRLHRFGSVHSRGQNRLPKPLFPAFLDFSRIPGLGIIIPDLEKLGV
ncbi:hypothetical protein CRG98_023846 [Punica granatum]|uniref:Uncharacterized protein n=1 Tax=Punica granatum TaxID=22663 RepID=A0A2I0JHQ0_PUNGR|nr:hypothetical protein CRG98_023846 [Punica granatum]